MPTMMLAEKNYMHCFHFSMIFSLIFCSFLRYPWWLSVIIFAMPAHALRFPRHKSKLAAFTEHAWLTTPLAVSLASCVNHRSGVCLSVCPLACVSPIVHRVLLWILTVSAASEHLRLHLLPVAMPGGQTGKGGPEWPELCITRISAIAEGPRDASCQLKSCQLPRNSAETIYTTSPDQIDGMKLEI